MDIYGNPVSYTGANPLSLNPTIGGIDTTWHDFTDFCEGLQDIELEWLAEKIENGKPIVGHFTPTKGVSGQVTFERDAHAFIKDWLVDDVAATLNQIEVQITDINCGRYIGYFIKSDQLEWCEYNALCVFNVNLKQIEDYTNCIERTLIADNWNGWFQDEPIDMVSGLPKKHPRFGYCVEKRPNWTLVLLWMLTIGFGTFLTILYTVIYPILLALYVIKLIIAGVVSVFITVVGLINDLIDVVNTFTGGSFPHIPVPDPYDPGDPPLTPVEVFLSHAQTMIEEAGCGREHPAPLVRDYLLNVCNKCGIVVSATTADTFFAPIISITHSDGLLYTEPNPHYNACYLFPERNRGVRRFSDINVFFGEYNPDTTTYFQVENAPTDSGSIFLDRLAKHYNCQWTIMVESGSPTLYFKRKDWFQNRAPLYDFSGGAPDRAKLVNGVCYEQQEITLPAYASDLYIADAADNSAAEAMGFYNGVQHVAFGNTVINPIFNGSTNTQSSFAAAHFNCDGTTTNYIYDALQVCYSLVTLTPMAVFVIPILATLGDLVERYANYKLLLQTETTTQPKLLIWDGDTDNPSDPNFLNATAMRDKINIDGTVYVIGHSGTAGTVTGINMPLYNTRYPMMEAAGPGTTFVPALVPDPLAVWDVTHPPKTKIIGRFPVFGATPGVYAVTSIVGTTHIPAPAILVNYPMYYEPHYLGSLWDVYHWINDPVRYPRLNKKWSVKIPLCCEDVERLRLTGNINGQRLLDTVLLDTPYYNLGVITKIRVVYEVGEDGGTGQYIEISGIV